ncbi:MAG TPA: cyclic nucleotide-binding domain-containing protein [Thermoanaerobaculia bacterium]|nr:cyclic nucleotide-binding domain-containing protein [Thermoanaerobaculia bacterium]
MGIKSWFGGSTKQAPQEYTIDDLVVLERYDEAGERLRARLKTNPEDLHTRLKLAEVYTQLKQYEKAVDEYGFVAEEYASDGFYDKGIALLSKAMKLAPLDNSLRFKVDKLQREKSMEQVRALALEGLRAAGGQKAGTSALQLGRLWHNLAGSSLVQHLSGEQLKRLFATMELVELPVGATFATEGSPEAFLLLLVQGIVDASVQGTDGKPILLRSFTSGDMVGEAALLERGTWPADYRPSEPTIALKLTREGLEKSLVGNSDPRAFLDSLREQHNDRNVAASLRRLRAGV